MESTLHSTKISWKLGLKVVSKLSQSRLKVVAKLSQSCLKAEAIMWSQPTLHPTKKKILQTKKKKIKEK